MALSLSGDGTAAGLNGLILQIATATGPQATSTSASWSDTGLSVTITPTTSTSKMIVLVSHATVQKQNNTGAGVRLLADSTTILTMAIHASYNGVTDRQDSGSVSGFAVHSPGSTSPVTYKTQLSAYLGSGTARVGADTGTSTMVVIEVAA